jgi:branched-chain amino acid transport system permease protein
MKRALFILCIWALLAAAGAVSKNNYYVSVATSAAFLAVWGQSWNLLGGLSGSLSLGHSMFVAIPAYVTVLLFQQQGLSVLGGTILGIIAAVTIAAVIGAATLRLTGPYFSLATLSAGAVVLSVILHYDGITGGPSGVAIPFAQDAPEKFEFTNVRAYYVIALTLLMLVTLILDAIKRSRLGFYIAAIKSSEEAAAAAGVRVAQVKVLAFCLSAALTAVGGVFYVFFIGFLDPNFLAGLGLSIKIALIAVVGGTGFLIGPIVGAIFYETIDAVANAYFGAAGGWDVMILGFSVVAIVMTEPRGLCFMVARGWQALPPFFLRRLSASKQ